MTFPTSSGSLENRNDSAFHGLMPYERHARWIVEALTLIRLSAYGLTCRLGYDLTCWSRRGDHGMASPVPATSCMRSLSR